MAALLLRLISASSQELSSKSLLRHNYDDWERNESATGNNLTHAFLLEWGIIAFVEASFLGIQRKDPGPKSRVKHCKKAHM